MKWAAILILITTCNQVLYDEIYMGILNRAVKSPLDSEDIKLKNSTIFMLRDLCNGQLSTYEKKNIPINNLYKKELK